MESITLAQAREFDQKRKKCTEAWKDYKERWMRHNEEFKNANSHSLEPLILKNEMFCEELLRLNEITAEIQLEHEEIKALVMNIGFIIWPKQFANIGGANKWQI